LGNGDQVDSPDGHGMAPLHFAVLGNHLDIAGLLLDRGADPNARAAIQMTPLHFASMLGRPELAGLLLRRGARTDARNSNGDTPLHLAADDKIVNVLLNAGAEVNARNAQGETPLHTARQGSVARTLLDRGADMRMRTAKGKLAMELAAVESLEPAGLSIHSLMIGRLRGLIGAMPFRLTNISSEPLTDIELSMRSPACDVEAEPDRVASLLPGEKADIQLSFTRTPSVAEGEHPVFIAISASGKKLGETDLRIDTRMVETPQDRGMIRLAKGQLRKAPSRWYYLVYASVPLLVLAAWFFLRKKS
jgi:ankyrin repeat protein